MGALAPCSPDCLFLEPGLHGDLPQAAHTALHPHSQISMVQLRKHRTNFQNHVIYTLSRFIPWETPKIMIVHSASGMDLFGPCHRILCHSQRLQAGFLQAEDPWTEFLPYMPSGQVRRQVSLIKLLHYVFQSMNLVRAPPALSLIFECLVSLF